MSRARIINWAVAVLSIFMLFFTVGPAHSLVTAKSLPDMGKQMTANQCQTACTPQQVFAAPINNREEEKDKEPQPAEPYYVEFIGVGWSLAFLISAHLLRHLNWRPPDLFKLNVNYRF